MVSIAVIAGAAFFFKLYSWWKNRKIEWLERTAERQDNAIEVYEKKEEIYKHDTVVDEKTEDKIEAVERKLGQGEESDANIVSGALNGFFGGEDKK